jgi:hypothetical protein
MNYLCSSHLNGLWTYVYIAECTGYGDLLLGASLTRCRDGLQAGWPEFDFRQGQEIFVYWASIPALGHTQPPIQWVPEALSPGVKRSGRETDHSPPCNMEMKNGGAISTLPHMSS